MTKQPHEHPSAERLQALLDGQLPPEGRLRVEQHVLGCARCAAELTAWRALFEELEDLAVLAPSAGFAERVIEGIEDQQRRPLAARARAALAAFVPVRVPRHPGDDRLQDFVEGLLSPRHAARVQAHLETCASCSSNTEAWRSLVFRLDGVGRFAPAEGFSDRVMAHVRVRAPTVTRAAPEWRRALEVLGRLVPHTRQAWAALSGIAVTPVATLGLVLWTLVTHPTLTAGALASFAWWKTAELAGALWRSIASAAVESTGLFEVYSFIGSLMASPALLVTAFALLSVGTLSAAWILYRNLVLTQPTDGRYAHASIS